MSCGREWKGRATNLDLQKKKGTGLKSITLDGLDY
jgi:hypothetical protein